MDITTAGSPCTTNSTISEDSCETINTLASENAGASVERAEDVCTEGIQEASASSCDSVSVDATSMNQHEKCKSTNQTRLISDNQKITDDRLMNNSTISDQTQEAVSHALATVVTDMSSTATNEVFNNKTNSKIRGSSELSSKDDTAEVKSAECMVSNATASLVAKVIPQNGEPTLQSTQCSKVPVTEAACSKLADICVSSDKIQSTEPSSRIVNSCNAPSIDVSNKHALAVLVSTKSNTDRENKLSCPSSSHKTGNEVRKVPRTTTPTSIVKSEITTTCIAAKSRSPHDSSKELLSTAAELPLAKTTQRPQMNQFIDLDPDDDDDDDDEVDTPAAPMKPTKPTKPTKPRKGGSQSMPKAGDTTPELKTRRVRKPDIAVEEYTADIEPKVKSRLRQNLICLPATAPKTVKHPQNRQAIKVEEHLTTTGRSRGQQDSTANFGAKRRGDEDDDLQTQGRAKRQRIQSQHMDLEEPKFEIVVKAVDQNTGETFPRFSSGDVYIEITKNQTYCLHEAQLSRCSPWFNHAFKDKVKDANEVITKKNKEFKKLKFRFELSKGISPNPDLSVLVRSAFTAISPPKVDTQRKVSNDNSNTVKLVARAYDTLFKIYYAAPFTLSRENIDTTLVEAEMLLKIAKHHCSVPQVIPHIHHALMNFGRNVYRAVSSDPCRWLSISVKLQSAPIFKEAVLHIVGNYPCYSDAFKNYAPAVSLLLQDKMKQLKALIASVTESLFKSAITINGKELHLKEGDDETSINSWIVIRIWQDWLRDALGRIAAAERSSTLDATSHRIMAEGHGAYLKLDEVLDTVERIRKGKLEPHEEAGIADDLIIMKGFAAMTVKTLVVNHSMLSPEQEGIIYFTCVDVFDSELPWNQDKRSNDRTT